MLEDIDFYCVDNILRRCSKPSSPTRPRLGEYLSRTAVGLDARNRPNEIETIPALVGELRRSGISCEVLYCTPATRCCSSAMRKHGASTRW